MTENKVVNHNEIDTEIEIKKIVINQDTKQIITSTFVFLIELYRIAMGSFLILFIPQKCGKEMCSMYENINTKLTVKYISLYFNLFTFLSFLVTYCIEYYRELLLIRYLEVDRFKSNDNQSVKDELQKIPDRKTKRIWKIDKYYKNSTFISIFLFVFNVVLSCIVIFGSYLDSKTISVLLTNFLFIILKVFDIYTNVNTKECIFFSAYLKKKVQFNSVDPDYNIHNKK
jgi:hypothetical protein